MHQTGTPAQLQALGWRIIYEGEDIYFYPNNPFVNTDPDSNQFPRRKLVYPTPPATTAPPLLPTARREMTLAVEEATELVFIGYSLPEYDEDLATLFRNASTRRIPIIVVSPDEEALKRFEKTLGPSVQRIERPFEDSLNELFRT
jgi:hypothetical protein